MLGFFDIQGMQLTNNNNLFGILVMMIGVFTATFAHMVG